MTKMKPHRIYKKAPSRYSGPAGDSRPWKEIEAKMIARAEESEAVAVAIKAALDIALKSREHASFEDRLALIRGACREWLFENDPELRTKLEGAGE